MKKYDTLVYIGRFQPFHNGHLEVVRQAFELADHVVILVGSSNTSRNPRNPFTFVERAIMIAGALADIGIKGNTFSIEGIGDYPYNDTKWISEVQNTIDFAAKGDKVGIIGFNKDSTSDYLRWFPNLETEILPVQFSTLNSSEMRAAYFVPYFRLPDAIHCPPYVINWLSNFTRSEEFKWIVGYVKQDSDDLAEYGAGPFLCADALVNQQGFILLVKRKNHPGKGQLALPGGHLNPKETLRDCSVRELREETKIEDNRGEIPPGRLVSFIDKAKTKLYDHPERSTGPRKITQLFRFNLPDAQELYYVRGEDDAERADWHSLGSLRVTDFFHDHAHLIMDQLGIVMKD